MRIGIDGGTWSNRRGYGRFLRELLPELVRLRPAWQFTIFLDQPRQDIITAPNLQWQSANTGQSVSAGAAANSARSVPDLWRMSRAVRTVEFDAFWFPTVYSYFPLLGRLPVAVGIHDTMADRHPQWAFAGKRQKLFWDLKVKLALAQAARIVTVSVHSRRSIAEHFGIDSRRIAVVSEAAAPVFQRADRSEEPYLLAVGGISPNKNLRVLIPALAALRARRPALRLVLAGDYKHDGFQGCYEELRAEADRCQVADAVVFAGYVPDEELAELYRRCAVYVMPSLEEGFGLPLVEAMACGCACVVAPGHALEEVGGDAVAVVKGDWAEAIGRVLDNDAERKAMRERSARRAAEFSWERGALALATVFEEMVSR